MSRRRRGHSSNRRKVLWDHKDPTPCTIDQMFKIESLESNKNYHFGHRQMKSSTVIGRHRFLCSKTKERRILTHSRWDLHQRSRWVHHVHLHSLLEKPHYHHSNLVLTTIECQNQQLDQKLKSWLIFNHFWSQIIFSSRFTTKAYSAKRRSRTSRKNQSFPTESPSEQWKDLIIRKTHFSWEYRKASSEVGKMTQFATQKITNIWSKEWWWKISTFGTSKFQFCLEFRLAGVSFNL